MSRNIKKASLFIALTFVLNWSMVILFDVFVGTPSRLAWFVMTVAYMFIPMLVAIVVQKVVYKEPLRKPLGISFRLNRWFLVAWLLPFGITFAAIGVSLLLPDVEFTREVESSRISELLRPALPPERREELVSQTASLPVHPFWLVLLQGLVAGVTINAIAGFGEELGWRGLLQRELGFLGFWRSSIVIGVIWGIWHAPIILHGHNYPDHPVTGVFMMIMFTILLAPILSFVRLKAKSVIAAAIMHGSLNAAAGLPMVVLKGGSDLTVGVPGLAGFIVLAVVNLAIFVYDRTLAKERVTLAQVAIES